MKNQMEKKMEHEMDGKIQALGLRCTSPRMESQIEKKRKNEMENGVL